MKNEINVDKFNSLIRYNNILGKNYSDIISLIGNVFENTSYSSYETNVQIDPRNNKRIIYCPERKQRYSVVPPSITRNNKKCAICSGDTTPIIMKEELSNNSYTFINENLYPAVVPFQSADAEIEQVILNDYSGKYQTGFGTHFVQWISTKHNDDFDTLNISDIIVVFKMLGEFEMYLLHSPNSKLPLTHSVGTDKHYGQVSIIKNCGFLAGSSMEHPHIQIIHSNIIPASIEADTDFLLKNKCTFIEYLDSVNRDELLIYEDDYIKAIIPYFMWRPYHTIVYPINNKLTHLHELNYNELFSLSKVINQLLLKLKDIAAKRNIEFAYNILFHTGPVGTFYIEIIPVFQTYGGYEHLGLFICEENPEICQNNLVFEKEDL